MSSASARVKRGKSSTTLGDAEDTSPPAKKIKDVSTEGNGDNAAFSAQPQYMVKLSEAFEWKKQKN